MPGRKSGHAASVAWNAAVSIAGSRERLIAGMPYRTWKGWEQAAEVPAYRVLPFLLKHWESATSLPRHDAPAVTAPRPDYLTPELQEVRMFTALVEALRKLDAAPPGHEPWRYWAAWKIVSGAARAVMELAGWTDADWRRVFERKLDHWQRPARGPRPEAETFKEWLEVER